MYLLDKHIKHNLEWRKKVELFRIAEEGSQKS